MKTIKNLKAEELRKSILQLAIQGKLVKQDPNDEPASELVKRIYEEKNKLISEGKIKKEKNQSYIFKGDDNCYYEKIGSNAPIMLKELPFDIPDNWMFIKLESLTFPVGSKANQISSKSVLKKGQWPVVSQSQKIIDGYSNENEKVISIKSESPIIMFGDHTRNVKIIDFSFIIGADGTKFFKPLLIDEKYLFFLISYVAGNLKNRGYARHYSLLKQELLPLPPLNEQLRIVSKIKSFEALIDKYDELEQKITSLELEFPEKFKKSILQYAIEGKLVKQDPNDEPASVLLERIKTEKEKLIKEGKIKQDKNESYIYQGDDKNYYEKIGNNVKQIEVPFNSNRVSKWIRLSDISKKIIDGNHNPPKGKFYKTDFLMLSSQNINNDAIVELDKCRYLTKEQFDVENKRTNISNNDILFTSVGTIGRTCVYNGVLNICFQRSVSIISTLINPYYLKIYLDSPKFQKKVLEEATGTAQKGFYLNQLSRSLVLVYSFEYQNRIVNRVNKLLNIVK